MRTIAKLFGKSPFAPLQAHMGHVADCVVKVNDLVDALEKGDYAKIEKLESKISKLEHAADLAKNDIRNSLPKGLFMPVNRASVLEILALQDSIADKAEDIGVLLTLRKLSCPDNVKDRFNPLVAKSLECFEGVRAIIDQLDELVEYSFGGREAIKVNEMVDDVSFKEHEADNLQQDLLKLLFNLEDGELHHADFYLWMQLISEVSAIANLSEKLAHRIRMMLELS